jgi:hypothetical protein
MPQIGISMTFAQDVMLMEKRQSVIWYKRHFGRNWCDPPMDEYLSKTGAV